MTPQMAQAHHRSGHSSSSNSRNGAAQPSAPDDLPEAASLDGGLDVAQRSRLETLLQGTDDSIIDIYTRREIQEQIDSLPPGIQRRLARGRALPPDIAKKVDLPTRVNEYVGLEEDIQVVVVGRDAVVLDPVTGVIVDVLRQILR